ncbi:MAG: hypothetical protein B7L53_07960 [Thermofilum sp. NZ13]|nr:MAG: hypothetical protein B7L53_07960 [Thermofilum sp. NZ13]
MLWRLGILSVAYWVLSGSYENWQLGLRLGVWGVRERARPLWEKVQPGDTAVFYAVGRGVLGYGTVREKFESAEPLWPEELKAGAVIWPLRLRIQVAETFQPPKPRPKGMLVAFPINKLSEGVFRELAR